MRTAAGACTLMYRYELQRSESGLCCIVKAVQFVPRFIPVSQLLTSDIFQITALLESHDARNQFCRYHTDSSVEFGNRIIIDESTGLQHPSIAVYSFHEFAVVLILIYLGMLSDHFLQLLQYRLNHLFLLHDFTCCRY